MKAIAALCDLVPGWVWAIVVAMLIGMGVWQSATVAHYKRVAADTKLELATTKMQWAESYARAQLEARAKERTLTNAAANLKEKKDAEINSLRADVRSLRDRLQHLPARPANGGAAAVAKAPEDGSVTYGPVLYRETAADLVSEAERADEIRIELRHCYDWYDAAAKVINGNDKQ